MTNQNQIYNAFVEAGLEKQAKMDIKKLNSENWKVYHTSLKFKKQADLTFNQYLTLIELYSAEKRREDVTYHELRKKLQISDKSDFNRTVMKPLIIKKLAWGDQIKASERKNAFITENGSELVEMVLKGI